MIPHPWFAVSDAQGEFKIEGVPPGKYTLWLRHPDTGHQDRRAVEVTAGKTTQVKIEWVKAAKWALILQGSMAPEAVMPITAQEAIKRLNQPVAVNMLVKRTKSCTCSSQFFLDCEENHRDPKNLGVVVTTAGAAKLKEGKIDDPAAHFMGKTIRVQGVVILKESRPYIEVDDPGQIEIVE